MPDTANMHKKPWPDGQATTVRTKAQDRDHQGALGTLDTIRDEIFGDADRVKAMADWWGQASVMADSQKAIDDSNAELAGYWEGGGYESYISFARTASANLHDNEDVLNEVSNVLASCVDIVYDTYSSAIRFISKCAHDLVDEEMDLSDVMMGPAGAIKLASQQVKVLNDFESNVADLIADSVEKMGDLQVNGIFLNRQVTEFKPLSKTPSGARNKEMWDVRSK